VKITPLGGRIKRCTYHVLNALSVLSQWLVANNNVTNVYRAVMTRVFNVKTPAGYAPPPQCTFDSANLPRALRQFRNELTQSFKPTPIASRQQVVDMYVGRKREIYQRAKDSLDVKHMSKMDARITSHIKTEKINISITPRSASGTARELQQKDPRIIQARTPRFNLELGWYLKPNEHRMFHAVDRVFAKFNGEDASDSMRRPTVMKGLNASKQGVAIAQAWNTFLNPVGIRMDASRFDQHCGRTMLEFEHSCYTRGFSKICDREDLSTLKHLLGQQLENKCTAYCSDGVATYTATARMSGDMNTGLGNVTIMCGMMYAFFSDVRDKIARDGGGKAKIVLINNGDDCCVLIERHQLAYITDHVEEFFLKYGYEMVVEGLAHELEEIKFCQSHPIWTPEGYRMVRTMPMCFAKDTINLKQMVNGKQYDEWRNAISGCGIALTYGIPMAQSFYQSLGRGTKMTKTAVYETGMDFLAHGMRATTTDIHPLSRVSVWKAFGISPDAQVEMERSFANIDVRNPTYDIDHHSFGVVGVGQCY